MLLYVMLDREYKGETLNAEDTVYADVDNKLKNVNSMAFGCDIYTEASSFYLFENPLDVVEWLDIIGLDIKDKHLYLVGAEYNIVEKLNYNNLKEFYLDSSKEDVSLEWERISRGKYRPIVLNNSDGLLESYKDTEIFLLNRLEKYHIIKEVKLIGSKTDIDIRETKMKAMGCQRVYLDFIEIFINSENDLYIYSEENSVTKVNTELNGEKDIDVKVYSLNRMLKRVYISVGNSGILRTYKYKYDGLNNPIKEI